MQLTITLRKDVDTVEQARNMYKAVKAKLADQPDITVYGHIVQDAEDDAPTAPPE